MPCITRKRGHLIGPCPNLHTYVNVHRAQMRPTIPICFLTGPLTRAIVPWTIPTKEQRQTKKQWAIYYTRHERLDGTPFYSEKLGSDGVAILDGRLGRARRDTLARTIGNSRKPFGVDGYRLARGSRLDSLFFLTAAVQPL